MSYQCCKMLRDPRDVEDTTQEALLVIYSDLHKLKIPEAFWGWVNTTTVNRCKNALTRNHVDLQFAEDEDGGTILDSLEDEDEQQVPDAALDNAETVRMINEIVDSLSEVQRICVLMYYYDEMSVRDIAKTLDISENMVKSRLSYARKTIEAKVLDCERKQGIRLHTLAPLPFLLYFLRRAAQESADSAKATAAAKNVMALGAAGGGTAAAGTALSHLMGGLSAKVIAGVLIGVLAVGGIAGAVAVVNRDTAEEPEPTATLPAQTEAVETEPSEDEPLVIPDPVGSPYDTVTGYNPGTYIVRTTLVTDLDNIEIYYELPVFPVTGRGIQNINTHFRELRDEFYRDESGNIAWALESARTPMVEGDLYFDNYRCSIETFDDELTSVQLLGSWYIGGVLNGIFPAYTFRTDTGTPLEVLDVLDCTAYEFDSLLTQAVANEGLLDAADLSGGATRFPFYVSDGAVYVGVPMTMGRDDAAYVRIDAPLRIGGSTPSEPPSGSPSDLLSSVAYYGDPAQCRMNADQARAFAEVIRSQSAELERLPQPPL